MAARKSLSHDETARRNIQTSQLINRLNDNANGKIEMTPSQVKSAEILLRKSLPDLASVSVTGEGGGPLVVQVTRFADQPPE